jgi:hypothetical protein
MTADPVSVWKRAQLPKPEAICRETLASLYTNYINNYLTVEAFAEHRGLYVDEAVRLLAIAKECHEVRHPEG